jgi:hypothetical protein
MKESNVNGGMALTKRELGFLRLLDRDQYTGTSILQPDQHDKLRKIIDLFEIIFYLLKACYEYFKKRKVNTGRVAIKSLAAALKGKFPDLSLDFSKVSILKGTLAPYCGAMYHDENSYKLNFSWSACTQRNSNQNDELMGMIYCPETREFWCEPNLGITRADGFCTIDVPAEFRDKELHVWLAYRSADQRSQSNSTYMGKVLITNTKQDGTFQK